MPEIEQSEIKFGIPDEHLFRLIWEHRATLDAKLFLSAVYTQYETLESAENYRTETTDRRIPIGEILHEKLKLKELIESDVRNLCLLEEELFSLLEAIRDDEEYRELWEDIFLILIKNSDFTGLQKIWRITQSIESEYRKECAYCILRCTLDTVPSDEMEAFCVELAKHAWGKGMQHLIRLEFSQILDETGELPIHDQN
jgi:hypothetical protein